MFNFFSIETLRLFLASLFHGTFASLTPDQPTPEPLDIWQALDIAPDAIRFIAGTAARLSATTKGAERRLCHALYPELLILSDVLSEQQDTLPNADHGSQGLERGRKILEEIEELFSPEWPSSESHEYPCLQAISAGGSNTRPSVALEEKILAALRRNLSRNREAVQEVLLSTKIFTRSSGITGPHAEEDSAPIRSQPVGYPGPVKKQVYAVLQKHTNCSCTFGGSGEPLEKRHLVRLLLQPLPSPSKQSHAHFELLISSAPPTYTDVHHSPQVVEVGTPLDRASFGLWQDVQLVAQWSSNSRLARRRRVAFIDTQPERMSADPAPSEEVRHGRFCRIIREANHSRLVLKIQDERLLQVLGAEPLQKSVEHVPTISLASVLEQYSPFTPRMKAALAYILAQSVWLYYDSDWMSTRWSSDNIHFVSQYLSGPRSDANGCRLYPSKPYLSVRFSGNQTEACEFGQHQEIHRFPRVRALGIILLEIGMGLPFPALEGNFSTEAARANEEWRLATQLSEGSWPPDFEYPKYRLAVKNCLDPKTFVYLPGEHINSKVDLEDALEKRRKVLYDRVVSPLEQFLEGTGWLAGIALIGPLVRSSRQVLRSLPVRTPRSRAGDSVSEAASSEDWLQRIDKLNYRLRSVAGSSWNHKRIRIAILDTGYDDDSGSGFFDGIDDEWGSRRDRFHGWKDYIDASQAPLDEDGHGTHLVSLIMRMAPDADIYVARVARNSKDFDSCSDNVAEVQLFGFEENGIVLTAVLQAIRWAQSEDVDIVSMSFGFVQDINAIGRAIHESLSKRNILFFAAAANSGANERVMFPARHSSVTAIRATDSEGLFQKFNPPKRSQENIAFGTLGLEVESATCGSAPDYVTETGTSVATAIAAGMAAMLLWYVNMKSTERAYSEVRTKLATQDGMMGMFHSIGQESQNGQYWYMVPWDLECDDDAERWSKFVAAKPL